MIQVNGKIKMGDNAENDAALAAVIKMVRITREEDGCLEYSMARDLADPDTLILFERWRDQEALQDHMKTPHMAEFQKTMAANPPVSTDIRMFVTDDGQKLG